MHVGEMKHIYMQIKGEELGQMLVYGEELSFGDDKQVVKYLTEDGWKVHKSIMPEGLIRRINTTKQP